MSVSIAQAQLFFLALTRILATIIHVPVLGGRNIPNQVKIGFGVLLAVIMLPWQPLPPGSEEMPIVAFTLAIGRELLVGTLAGFAAVMVFAVLQIAGNLMGQSSGFSAGQMLNPALEATGSPLDQVFIMTAFLLFLVINGHHAFLLGLQRTFEIVPLNTPLPAFSLDRLVELTGGLITAGVHMALPVMGALLLTDLTLGLLARVAPQIQVFFLGIPLKVGAGLLALAAFLSIIFPVLSDLLRSVGPRTLELLGA
ncbi:MAG: flagellar biosynthetic protein FliR [Chloroflexi bacterium]|nr:flagellar biosynthetic protein FliR [Chloroflexota bacterium]